LGSNAAARSIPVPLAAATRRNIGAMIVNMHIALAPVKSTSQQPPLAELAKRIRAEHQSVIASIRQGAQHAMAAGDLLLEVKRRLGHGHFGKWLEANCSISDRTARLYMSLAENRAAVEAEANRQRVADLTVRGAVKAIAAPAKPKAPKAQPIPSPVK